MVDFPENIEIQKKASKIMQKGMDVVDLFINKNYLINMDKCNPIPLNENEKSFSYMSLFQIDKIVYDLNENINDKLVSVYSSLSNFGTTAILVIDSDENGIKFYVGTRDTNQPYIAKEILKKSICGNFPGINIKEQNFSNIEQLLEGRIPELYSNKAVSSVSIVPSMRDEDKEKFVQGMEKFIDSMSSEKYIAIFISSPLSKQELQHKKRGYEELYSTLSQCSEVTLTYGENDSESVAIGISDGFSDSVNEGISNTTGENSGVNTGEGKSRNISVSKQLFGMNFNFGGSKNYSDGSFSGTSESRTESRSDTKTKSITKSDTKTDTTGTSTSLQIKRENKTVTELLAKIDEQLKRIKNCESYGLWNSACYFISEKQETSIVAANTYKALVAGEKTSVENSFINLWDNEYRNANKSLCIMDYLRYGLHPRFEYLPQNSRYGYKKQIITPALTISGVELPLLMGLPHKSVSGITSIESAEFGRNIFYKNAKKSVRNINLGSIYHMGEVFSKNRVKLNLDSLTSHCFITGSTGSGKSNTTYKIIDELTNSRNNVKFLVIEPAKGEYKLAFGDMPGINIFTSNPKYYNMLSINPFEFHEEIHVLEHLDRLIEIFSACWPLYAAMPAILKSSFERAYISHGWDLNHSFYIDKGNGKFPTFKDIAEILPVLLDESDFSAEVRGNYVGSLVTRVESLTNGLVGQIFNNISVSDEVLFNENTIIDLSRIGSAETKALIMGILVLKLSEFRQSTSKDTNLPLQHVTILEEAHNLLKRTSTDQGQESANVQGKSVEMISNSIAEMRTYGEGFIIVDQSPSAVDISAIRNTNTKIIMRLPEVADCEAMGKSVGLNDDQIKELSRLDNGVACVYQNNWLESVLTKIDKCSEQYETNSVKVQDPKLKLSLLGELLEELIIQNEENKFNIIWLKQIVNNARVSNIYKNNLNKMIEEYYKEYTTSNKLVAFAKLISKLLNCDNLLKMYEDILPPKITKKSELNGEPGDKCKTWCDKVYKNLDYYAEFYDKKTKDKVFLNIILNQSKVENIKEKKAKYKVLLHYFRRNN